MRVINIELKNNQVSYNGIERRVLDLVKEFNLLEQVIFSSFNHYSLNKINKLESKAQRGILYYAKIFKPWEYAFSLNANNLHMNYFSVDCQIVKKCRENDINVNVYRANRSIEIEKMIKMGVNIIITSSLEEAIKIRNNN